MFEKIGIAIEKMFTTGDYLQILLFAAGIWFLWIAVRIQMGKNAIDFKDMLIGTDGKVSNTRVFILGSFLLSSWGFVVLVVRNQMTEYYFTWYMVVWSGTSLTAKWMQRDQEMDKTNIDSGVNPKTGEMMQPPPPNIPQQQPLFPNK